MGLYATQDYGGFFDIFQFFSISGTIMVNLVFGTGDGQPAFASSLFKGSTVDPKP